MPVMKVTKSQFFIAVLNAKEVIDKLDCSVIFKHVLSNRDISS